MAQWHINLGKVSNALENHLIAHLDRHYARTSVIKPLVVGEIGYEGLAGTHLQDFQRAAFWLAMLNGAARYTYGAAGTHESYTERQPFQRKDGPC